MDKLREGNSGKIPPFVSPWFTQAEGKVDTSGLIEAQQIGKLVNKLVTMLETHSTDRQIEALRLTAERFLLINQEMHPDKYPKQVKVFIEDGSISDF